MKINTIKLNNIGPYRDNNIFDLQATNTNLNITLIGGKNGTGKTTLLKSIKIGLFGCFSYGYKTANATYFKEIKNMLNNQSNKGSQFYIEIAFSYIENFKILKYTIHREWVTKNNELKEIVKVKLGDKELNDYESLELENKLKSLTSPALINSFIYDGEKISSIIEQGELEQYVREMFNSIFNIDLLEQLSQDLTAYMIRSYKSNNKTIEYDIANTLNSLNFVKSDIKTNETFLNNLAKDIDNLNIEISSKKKEFETLGGLTKEDIVKVSNLVNEIEKRKEENNGFLKFFSEEYLHLAMLLNELKEVSRKAKKELPLRYARQLEVIQEYLNENLSKYITKLKSKTKCEIFGLEKDEIDALDSVIKHIKDYKEHAIEILNDKSLSENLLDLRSQLDKNSSMNKLMSLSNDIETLQAKLNNKKEEYNAVSSKLKEKYQERDNLIKKYDAIAENVRKDKLTNSSYVQCTNSLRLCEAFKNKLIVEKLNKVADMACEIFNKTIRKSNYVKKMKFEKDFSFKLYSGNDIEMSPQVLSAGEMQILVSSIIWAMFKISKRKEMFVFDTPLARLDTENRIQFIKNIMSTISDQVIVLSTDSEFIGRNLKAIEKNLSRKYLLEYNDTTKTTSITNEYFGD